MNKNFGVDFTVETLLGKIPELLSKGKAAELKKSEQFINTLKNTQVIIKTYNINITINLLIFH